MKKIILLIILSFAVLSSAFSDDVLTYTGAGSEIPSSNLSLTFETNSVQWLGESGYFRYGFYTNQNDVKTVTKEGSDTNTTTLIFKESPTSSGSDKITYSASASFSIYVYILSNNKYKLTLSWTDLSLSTASSLSTDEIPSTIAYTVAGETSEYTFYIFDPASGIYDHEDWTFNAVTTKDYEIPTKFSNVVYTGTMTLKMETTS